MTMNDTTQTPTREPTRRSSKIGRHLSVGFLADRLLLEAHWTQSGLTGEEQEQLKELLEKLAKHSLVEAGELLHGGCF